MKKSELKQLIKEQILAEVEAISYNQQIYGFTVNDERIEFELDKFNNLNCIEKNLKTLVVNDPKIKKIFCSINQLTTLKLGRLPNLEILSCWDNQLTTLDVSKCLNLKELYCDDNQLTSLNIFKCSKLETLSCYGNQLKSLNVSNCPNLKYLDCYTNQLVNLNLSKCPNLENLDCYDNNLTTLDVSMCPNLKDLDYDEYKTQLITTQELNEVKPVSHNQQIYGETIDGEIINFKLDKFNDLSCFKENLKTLIVNDSRVKGIFCSVNQLTTLKLGRLPNLEILDCSENNLASLDVSKCPNLERLFCKENNLTSLDISKCPNLRYLDYNKGKTKLIK